MKFTALLLAAGASSAIAAAVATAPAIRDASATAPATTAVPTHDCLITECVEHISLCAYWGGITSWGPTGPVPGMVHTTLGNC